MSVHLHASFSCVSQGGFLERPAACPGGWLSRTPGTHPATSKKERKRRRKKGKLGSVPGLVPLLVRHPVISELMVFLGY